MSTATKMCDFCEHLKIQKFDMTKIEVDVVSEGQAGSSSKDLKKIEKKLKNKKVLSKKDKKLRKIMKDLLVLLGNGERVTTLTEAVAKLLVRNYPELVKWQGDAKLVIFIPDYFLNKAIKYVAPEKGQELLENLEKVKVLRPDMEEDLEKHRKIVLGAKKMYGGEVPEVNLYKALQERFSKNDESLAIFHGLDIMKFDPDRQDNNVCEKDFILVSATHGYVAVIECKRTIGKDKVDKKSVQQLKDTKGDLESYFRNFVLESDQQFSPDWIFIPLIYCEDVEGESNHCGLCENHIIKGNS